MKGGKVLAEFRNFSGNWTDLEGASMIARGFLSSLDVALATLPRLTPYDPYRLDDHLRFAELKRPHVNPVKTMLANAVVRRATLVASEPLCLGLWTLE